MNIWENFDLELDLDSLFTNKNDGSYIPDAHTKFYIDRPIETMGIPYLCR